MAAGRRMTRRWAATIAAVGLGLAASVTAVTLAAPASAATDLALGKTASASSAEAGRPASHAVDGNAGTRWCAVNGSTGQWLQVDLGGTAALTSTQVVWEFARTYRYQVSVSTDGSTWTTVADRSASTATAQNQTDTFAAQARYVRITVTGLAAGTWASITSFSVFGTGGTGPTPPPTGQPYKGLGNPACADVARLNLSWYYNWWISAGSCTAPGFVPTISGKPAAGKGPKSNGDIQWEMDQVKRAGHKTVFGFNEPNKADQANMTVARTIELWPILTADPSIRVSSPSTSADKNGQDWITEFLRQADARKLRVDFLNIHWYGWSAGSCDNIGAFEGYLNWVERLPGNRPIWITEFGCLHDSNLNATKVQEFYTKALAMLANHPRVERHAWYPWERNNWVVAPGTTQLTPLGVTLANAPKYR